MAVFMCTRVPIVNSNYKCRGFSPATHLMQSVSTQSEDLGNVSDRQEAGIEWFRKKRTKKKKKKKKE